jgi:hypothetical protein
LSGFLTPATYKTVLFPFGTLSSSLIQSNIVEWSSPDFHTLPAQILLAVILLLILGGILLRQTQSQTPDLTEILWGLATLVLALTSLRHIALFVTAGAPLIGRNITAIVIWVKTSLSTSKSKNNKSLSTSLPRKFTFINAFILIVLALLGLLYASNNLSSKNIDVAITNSAPVKGTDYILQNHLPAPVFNFYDYGGYLIWRTYPQYRVFIDGRVEVYGDQVFLEYLQVNDISQNWEVPLNKYHVQTILMPSSHPLRQLLENKGWKMVYQDSQVYIYTRQ